MMGSLLTLQAVFDGRKISRNIHDRLVEFMKNVFELRMLMEAVLCSV